MEEDYDYREEDTDPKPSEVVRQMFKDGFMPFDITLEENEQMESGMEMCVRDDDVTMALILDPGLLPSVLNNGELFEKWRSMACADCFMLSTGYVLTSSRVAELIDIWHDQFQDPKMIMKFAKVSQPFEAVGC